MFWVSAEPSDSTDEVDIPRSIHRLVVGVESLMLQGWPALQPRWAEHLRKFPDNALRHSFAGHAFAGAVVAA
eukprot:9261598-Lingulodinium_polyedra.AAC.1